MLFRSLLEYLRQFADDNIVPDLDQIEGVAGVMAQGGREQIFEVRLAEEKIRSLGLRPHAIAGSLRTAIGVLAEADVALKRGLRNDPERVLEELVVTICEGVPRDDVGGARRWA